MIELVKAKFFTESGDPMKPVYTPKLQSDGFVELVQTGEEDLQEYIDSFAEECTIDYVLKRCAVGDQTVLSKRQGVYGDFTDVPKTYAEVLQKVIDGHTYFDSLPLAVRKKFDQSFEKWFMMIGSDDWLKMMAPDPEPQPRGVDVVPDSYEKDVSE